MVVSVAVGGTFEVLHKGHHALLARAFEKGGSVLIGLTSDEMASASRGREVKTYDERRRALVTYLEEKFLGRAFHIEAISDPFGPAIHLADLKCLVVSENTRATGERLNRARAEKGLGPVELLEVPHVLADDGMPISSSRILAGECDPDGHPL